MSYNFRVKSEAGGETCRQNVCLELGESTSGVRVGLPIEWTKQRRRRGGVCLAMSDSPFRSKCEGTACRRTDRPSRSNRGAGRGRNREGTFGQSRRGPPNFGVKWWGRGQICE